MSEAARSDCGKKAAGSTSTTVDPSTLHHRPHHHVDVDHRRGATASSNRGAGNGNSGRG